MKAMHCRNLHIEISYHILPLFTIEIYDYSAVKIITINENDCHLKISMKMRRQPPA